MRKHSGIKPYKCQFCENTFPSIGNCKDHERRHQKIRPYQCLICETVYYRNYQLVKHIKTKHPNEKAEECILKLIKDCQQDSLFESSISIVKIMTQQVTQFKQEQTYLQNQSKTSIQNSQNKNLKQNTHQEFLSKNDDPQILVQLMKKNQIGKINIQKQKAETKLKIKHHYKNKNSIQKQDDKVNEKNSTQQQSSILSNDENGVNNNQAEKKQVKILINEQTSLLGKRKQLMDHFADQTDLKIDECKFALKSCSLLGKNPVKFTNKISLGLIIQQQFEKAVQ
eukprot:403360276